MREKTEFFKIDGKALLAPDQDVEMSFEDIDAAQSGRDESGYMHRFPVRYKVGVWNFRYCHLTKEEHSYLLSCLPLSGSFTFTYPVNGDGTETKTCAAYLSGYSLGWRSARTGDFRNLRFCVIEC